MENVGQDPGDLQFPDCNYKPRDWETPNNSSLEYSKHIANRHAYLSSCHKGGQPGIEVAPDLKLCLQNANAENVWKTLNKSKNAS